MFTVAQDARGVNSHFENAPSTQGFYAYSTLIATVRQPGINLSSLHCSTMLDLNVLAAIDE